MSSNERPYASPENTSEIARLRSEVSKLQAKLADSERGRIEYLQNVAHQLVAPLNAMKWHIENITSNRVSVERAKKVLRSIYSQATIAVHLAKNFALMSNLEADHSLAALKEPLEPVALAALLVNLADDFQPQGWDREIHIDVVDSGLRDAPDVLVMKPLISQVFGNIIENAIKYSTPKTRVKITGSYHKAQDMVIVRIENRGIPIPEADVERIFERGYRSIAAKTTAPAGTGFGLYIAKRLVAMHSGDIEVILDDDGLTAFEVSLPVSELKGRAKEWPKKAARR